MGTSSKTYDLNHVCASEKQPYFIKLINHGLFTALCIGDNYRTF